MTRDKIGKTKTIMYKRTILGTQTSDTRTTMSKGMTDEIVIGRITKDSTIGTDKITADTKTDKGTTKIGTEDQTIGTPLKSI